MNIYSGIVIQVADSQQERRPSWRKCWRGEREGDETRIVSVISSGGGGASLPAQLRVARLAQRQQASAVVNYNSCEMGGVVW